MNDKKEIIGYIVDYFKILINNYKLKKQDRIPSNEIFNLINDLNGLIEELYKIDYKKSSELCTNKFIPIINYVIKSEDNIDYEKTNNILKNAYRISARTSLKSYFIYREWEEKTEDKFYEPRRRILEGYIYYLEQIAKNPKFRLLIANMPSGYGKLIANDVPVLTKDGWKKHGDLKVGDYVISPKGEFIRVNLVHPKRYANTKVTFEDGEVIYCHNQHEWQVYDRNARKEKQVETTYLMENLKEKDGRTRFYLPLIEPVKGEHKDLPVDPYTYGVWLGDGMTKGGRITENINDFEIFNYIPYEISSINNGINDNVKNCHLKGLSTDLHKIGLCYQNKVVQKYIHDSYLTADISQRLELLAGIIDTDGYLDRIKQRYIITTASEKLKEDIVSLIYTFNWRVSITTIPPKKSSSGIQGKKNVYYIGFSPTMKIPCKLERKQLQKVHKQRRIGFSNIEFVDLQQGNCITVDGGLYLVGRTLKITHNTYPEKISEAWNFGYDSTGTVLALCSNEDVVKGGSRTVIDELKSKEFGEVFPNIAYNENDKNYFLKETESNWKLRDCKLASSYVAKTTQSNVVGTRASQRVHIDDLYSDYKEALNVNTNSYYFNKYNTVWRKRFVQNLIPKIVVTGTLWASGDFISLLIQDTKKNYKLHKHPKFPFTYVNEDETIVIIKVPALDYNTGLSVCPELRTTEEVIMDKNSMDEYLFQTNFQQIPTDPEALFFSYKKLRTYSKIPHTDYIGTYSVIDATRKSGKDFFSMPIFSKVEVIENKGVYERDTFDYYLKDCLFTRTATKDMYEEICKKIIEHHIIKLVIESNVTSELKQNIDAILRENGVYYCEILEKYNSENKKARINDEKGVIVRAMVFPEKNMYGESSQMGRFMNNLTLYNEDGRNSNDDAPDSLAMFSREIISGGCLPIKVKPVKRIF